MKVLGLPAHCTSFELRCAVNKVPTVRCEYYPLDSDGNLDRFRKIMQTFELKPCDE